MKVAANSTASRSGEELSARAPATSSNTTAHTIQLAGGRMVKPSRKPGKPASRTSKTKPTARMTSLAPGHERPGRASAAATIKTGYSAIQEKIFGAIKPEKIPPSTPPSDIQK